MVRISIQGDKASFHDIAAEQFFGSDSSRIPCDTFSATVAALVEGKVDYALCAIENSLYGSINEVYDLILSSKVQICGEVYLRVEQCLIGLPQSDIGSITSVYSHPVALAQCEEYLETHLGNAKRLEYHDTAASVDYIKQLADTSVGAIASRQAATLHGMKVLAESIETNKENYTRFVVLSQSESSLVERPNKTSLILKTNHKPGALYTALGAFANRGINLSKIQSRPIVGKAWHYMFYIDVDAGIDNVAYQQSIKDLEAQACDVVMAGSYVSGK